MNFGSEDSRFSCERRWSEFKGRQENLQYMNNFFMAHEILGETETMDSEILIASYCSFSFIYAAFIFMVSLLLMVSFVSPCNMHIHETEPLTIDRRKAKRVKIFNGPRSDHDALFV